MASKYTKISRTISELKLFLDYNNEAYYNAFKHIKSSEGWHIPFYANEIYNLLGNIEGNLYENIYEKLTDEDPVSDEEIINTLKGVLTLFDDSKWIFQSILKKKKETSGEQYLSTVEGIVQELLYKATLKLKEVIQLAEEDLLRSKKVNTEEELPYTICIITAALEEYRTLLSKIPNASTLPTESNDSQIYQRGTIDGKDGQKINVIFTLLHHQGIAAATNTTTKMILTFKPSLVVMLGHAAGNKSLKRALNVGDILICKEAIDYDSAIIIDRGSSDDPKIEFKAKPNPIKADSSLIQSLKNFVIDDENLKIIKEESRHNQLIEEDLHFKDGKLISGDALVRSKTWFNQVTSENHEAIGLDMETFGVYYAAQNTIQKNKPLFVSIKSVSDFGENGNDFPEKIKDHKIRVQYAIDTSIIFFLKYAEKNMPF